MKHLPIPPTLKNPGQLSLVTPSPHLTLPNQHGEEGPYLCDQPKRRPES